MKTTYHLIFRDRENAEDAARSLRERGQVVVRQEEDDHDRFYRVAVTTGDNPPMPLEMDKLAREHEGELDGTESEPLG